jgi:hypothetical protein
VVERTKEFLAKYGHNYTTRNNTASKFGIKTEVLVAIAFSETSLGYATKGNRNLLNCGNNDRGDVVHYSTLAKGLSHGIQSCLNGTYSKHKTTLSHLYPNHKESTCKSSWDEGCTYVFASSKENAFNNVANVLSNIYQSRINSDFNFRK